MIYNHPTQPHQITHQPPFLTHIPSQPFYSINYLLQNGYNHHPLITYSLFYSYIVHWGMVHDSGLLIQTWLNDSLLLLL